MKTAVIALRRFGILIVAFHFLISLVHGFAHSRLHIEMNQWQTLYILIVITVLPLVSAVMLWRRSSIGFLLLFASMLGSFVFGGYYHFVAAGADNVSSLGTHAWAPPFQVTAVLLAITEAAGTLLGLSGMSGRRAKN